jgi:hypothetical protein
MTKKVVDLRAVKPSEPEKPKGIDPNMLITMAEFTAIMEAYEAKAFAAVAVNKDGHVIDTWYTAMPHCALIGAMDMMKNDYLMNQWMADQEEDE